jgi:hypothetical protein
MRRTSVLLLLVALSGAALAGVGSASTAPAALRLLAVSPLTVVGTDFHSRERTRVTATSPGATQTLRVTATRIGSLRVIFDELTPTRCDLIRVVAIRRGGTIVVLKRLPSPACLPSRTPGRSPG